MVPPRGRMPRTAATSSGIVSFSSGPFQPSRKPTNSYPYSWTPLRTTARITALSPGQSPPPVSTPTRIAHTFLRSSLISRALGPAPPATLPCRGRGRPPRPTQQALVGRTRRAPTPYSAPHDHLGRRRRHDRGHRAHRHRGRPHRGPRLPRVPPALHRRRVGGARPGRDLGRRDRRRGRGAGPRAERRRGRAQRGRHHQPARDDRALGPRDPGQPRAGRSSGRTGARPGCARSCAPTATRTGSPR